MHFPFLLSVLLISLCWSVESVYNKKEDKQFRKKSKDVPEMRGCSSLEEKQIKFFDGFFGELAKLDEDTTDISLDVKGSEYNLLGITNVFHMALDVSDWSNEAITVLKVGSCVRNEKIKLLKDNQRNMPKSPKDCTRDAAVEVLNERKAKMGKERVLLVEDSTVMKKASFFYDEYLWKNANDESAGPYLQYAIAFVRKRDKNDKSVEPGNSTSEKKGSSK